MTAPVFVDTNILIYAMDDADLKKQQAARLWRAHLWKSRQGRVSMQVLQEFYVKVSQKSPTACEHARAEMRDLMAWRPRVVDDSVLETGCALQERYQLSFWDALIVAAAKLLSCRYLLTEDLQADLDLDGVLVVNPFVCDPASLPPR